MSGEARSWCGGRGSEASWKYGLSNLNLRMGGREVGRDSMDGKRQAGGVGEGGARLLRNMACQPST